MGLLFLERTGGGTKPIRSTPCGPPEDLTMTMDPGFTSHEVLMSRSQFGDDLSTRIGSIYIYIYMYICLSLCNEFTQNYPNTSMAIPMNRLLHVPLRIAPGPVPHHHGEPWRLIFARFQRCVTYVLCKIQIYSKYRFLCVYIMYVYIYIQIDIRHCF